MNQVKSTWKHIEEILHMILLYYHYVITRRNIFVWLIWFWLLMNGLLSRILYQQFFNKAFLHISGLCSLSRHEEVWRAPEVEEGLQNQTKMWTINLENVLFFIVSDYEFYLTTHRCFYNIKIICLAKCRRDMPTETTEDKKRILMRTVSNIWQF